MCQSSKLKNKRKKKKKQIQAPSSMALVFDSIFSSSLCSQEIKTRAIYLSKRGLSAEHHKLEQEQKRSQNQLSASQLGLRCLLPLLPPAPTPNPHTATEKSSQANGNVAIYNVSHLFPQTNASAFRCLCVA